MNLPELRKARRPNFIGHGPCCEHDIPCAVYWDTETAAVYNMNDQVFEPSWEAQADGFVLLQVRWHWLKRFLQRRFPPSTHGGRPRQADIDRRQEVGLGWVGGHE
jgi:hypothetical protein